MWEGTCIIELIATYADISLSINDVKLAERQVMS